MVPATKQICLVDAVIDLNKNIISAVVSISPWSEPGVVCWSEYWWLPASNNHRLRKLQSCSSLLSGSGVRMVVRRLQPPGLKYSQLQILRSARPATNHLQSRGLPRLGGCEGWQWL